MLEDILISVSQSHTLISLSSSLAPLQIDSKFPFLFALGGSTLSKLLVLDLSLGFHGSDNAIHLSRTFKASSRCQINLRKYYDRISKFLPPKTFLSLSESDTCRHVENVTQACLQEVSVPNWSVCFSSCGQVHHYPPL